MQAGQSVDPARTRTSVVVKGMVSSSMVVRTSTKGTPSMAALYRSGRRFREAPIVRPPADLPCSVTGKESSPAKLSGAGHRLHSHNRSAAAADLTSHATLPLIHIRHRSLSLASMQSLSLLVYFSAIRCSAHATMSVKVLRFFRYLPSCAQQSMLLSAHIYWCALQHSHRCHFLVLTEP